MSENNNTNIPRIDDQPVPLWIKIMWLFAITWVLTYIYLGLTK